LIAAYALALQAVFSGVLVGQLAAPAAFDLPNIICSAHDEAAVAPALPDHPVCPHGMDCIMAGCGAIGHVPQAVSRPLHQPVARVAMFAPAPSWLLPTRLGSRPQDPRGPPIAA
jgi:hypothetical protein